MKAIDSLEKATKSEREAAKQEVIDANGLTPVDADTLIASDGSEWTLEDLATATAEVLKGRSNASPTR